MVVGAFPLKRLFDKPSCAPAKVPSQAGKAPERRFSSSLRLVKVEKSPASVSGIVPLRTFELKPSCFSDARLPREEGMDPLSEFEPSWRYCSRERLPRAAGIVPPNELLYIKST